jgi:hypothetical protein
LITAKYHGSICLHSAAFKAVVDVVVDESTPANFYPQSALRVVIVILPKSYCLSRFTHSGTTCQRGETALLRAAKHGQAQVVSTLLAFKANPNCQDKVIVTLLVLCPLSRLK